MIKELNRVSKLGYECEIVWNKHIQIYFDFSKYDGMEYYENVSVLTCTYDEEFSEHPFQKYVEESCQIFYTWYSKNNNRIQDFIKNERDDKFSLKISRELGSSLSLGDVSTQINRTLNIDDILEY
jgi:hypothetical protein